ncbi:MAG: PIN domain-containing protein [Burkholderiaceae bacterium]|nr:PIN domain-containing protein [Burkholderiaceae bacterium]
MSADTFLDTNVFVHHLDATDKTKHAVAERIVGEGLLAGTTCISFQVVQEFLNVATRKFRRPLAPDLAREYLDTVLAPMMKVPASIGLYQRALDMQVRWRFGFYDSLVVAAALAAGCTRLLTEDLQDGQRIEALTIENPFR